MWELRDWLVGQWSARGLAPTLGSPTGPLGTSDVMETMSCGELVARRAEVDRLAAVIRELDAFARRAGLFIIVGVPGPTTIESAQPDLPIEHLDKLSALLNSLGPPHLLCVE